MAIVKSFKADVSSVSPSSERFPCFNKVVVKKRFKIPVHSRIKMVLKILPDAQTTKNKTWKKRSKRIK